MLRDPGTIRALDCLAATWRRLGELAPSGDVAPGDGMDLIATGAPAAFANQGRIWRAQPDARASIADAIAFFDERDLPFLIEVADDLQDAAAAALDAGLTQLGRVPFMTLASPAPLPCPDGFTIELLTHETFETYIDIAATAFGMARDLATVFCTPAMLVEPAARLLLGRLDGEPVATALGWASGDIVGVFNIATSHHARGRGIGAAMTAAAADGDHRSSYLQASSLGQPVYAKMGYATVGMCLQFGRSG